MARKKRKSLIKRITKFLFLLFLIMMLKNTILYLVSINDHINLKKLDISLYIEKADEESKGKKQINWKYLAAIDGVRYKNEFSNVNEESIKILADRFIKENNTIDPKNRYELKSLEQVLDELQLEKKEKKKVHQYIDDLKYEGIVSSRLGEGSPYMEFINGISEEAIKNYDEYGILPSITIAQAILESNWGKSELSVKGNNLFGIKADKSWKGQIVKMNTSEYYNKNTTAGFRMYEDKNQSLEDHGKFLYTNKRYKENGVFDATYYIEQAQALENAGYSTKENKKGEKIYADILIDLIRQYNLQLIDHDAQMKASRED